MSEASQQNIELEYNRPWGEFLLWFGILGPACAWGLHLQAMYVLTQPACARHTLIPLHVTTGILLALSLLALLVSWRDFVRLGLKWPSSREGGVVERSRFMAASGVFLSLLFSLVILFQWVAVFFFRPCVE